jgi:NitT/TauT family transport system permease protein
MNWLRRLVGGTGPGAVILVIVGSLLVWEAAVWIFQPPPYLLPPPSQIFREAANAPGWYLRHAGFTFGSAALGFVIAVSIGILAAVGIVYSKFLENTLYTFLVAINSVPKIALARCWWCGSAPGSSRRLPWPR